jgi:hypothetical protein
MTPSPDSQRRCLVYSLLIAVAASQAVGRIASAERLYEPSLHRPKGSEYNGLPLWPEKRPDPWPTFSSNDRSRWAAVRSLVDEGTFVIGQRSIEVTLASSAALFAGPDPLQEAVLAAAGQRARIASDSGIVFEDGWGTVDKVLQPTTLQFYSTKPPLLTVLAAAEYWALKNALGWSIIENPWQVIPAILITFNVVPMVLYLALLALLLERWGQTDWGRYFVLGTACFGTLVTPFLISFNNHTIAVCTTMIAVYAVVRLLEGGGPGWFALAGFAAGLTAAAELPATAFAVGVGVYLLWRWPARALAFFVPAALVPVAALLGCNYAEFGRLKLAYAEFGGPWYEYEGSHWLRVEGVVRRGIDWASRSEGKWAYAFHMMLGHHGLFSLTPVLALAAVGMVQGAWRVVSVPLTPQPPLPQGERGSRNLRSLTLPARYIPAPPLSPCGRGGAGGGEGAERRPLDLLATFTLLLSLVVIGYYIFKSDNYGGWSNGLRWLMWLTPLWLLSTLPVADSLARSPRLRALGLLLLAISIGSMTYQQWNPWRHPWLYAIMEQRGWIHY